MSVMQRYHLLSYCLRHALFSWRVDADGDLAFVVFGFRQVQGTYHHSPDGLAYAPGWQVQGYDDNRRLEK